MSDAKKVLSKAFVDNNEDVNEDTAMEGIVKAEQKIKELQEEKDADSQLAAAKQIVKDINAGYSSAVKYERAKINFYLEKLAEIQSGEVNPSSGANS